MTPDPDPADDPVLTPFRQAMRRHAGGVCIVTCRQGETVNGMVVTSATSFSMAPPSILICLNTAVSLLPMIQTTGGFGLTVLGHRHEAVARGFSRTPSGASRFTHGAWHTEPEQQPWLEDAPANLSCEVETSMAYGTHVALIGRIVSVRLGPDTDSLVYRDGTYL